MKFFRSLLCTILLLKVALIPSASQGGSIVFETVDTIPKYISLLLSLSDTLGENVPIPLIDGSITETGHYKDSKGDKYASLNYDDFAPCVKEHIQNFRTLTQSLSIQSNTLNRQLENPDENFELNFFNERMNKLKPKFDYFLPYLEDNSANLILPMFSDDAKNYESEYASSCGTDILDY